MKSRALPTICSSGRQLATYRMKGSLWALPVDAACQVAVSRPDLMQALDAGAAAELERVGRARRQGEAEVAAARHRAFQASTA